MSDLKWTCPACSTHSSDIGIAFREGRSCPFCGLPADAAFALDEARVRGAEQSTIDMAGKAESRAAVAEAEVARLRGLLIEIQWAAERASEDAEVTA